MPLKDFAKIEVQGEAGCVCKTFWPIFVLRSVAPTHTHTHTHSRLIAPSDLPCILYFFP